MLTGKSALAFHSSNGQGAAQETAGFGCRLHKFVRPADEAKRHGLLQNRLGIRALLRAKEDGFARACADRQPLVSGAHHLPHQLNQAF